MNKYPCEVERNCHVCNKVGMMYLMFSSQKRNLFYCSDECRALAYKLTRTSKQAARLRERDEEYWRQLRVSYNLEDRRV